MERTGKREGVLFLDEINCVSETLAPTMHQPDGPGGDLIHFVALMQKYESRLIVRPFSGIHPVPVGKVCRRAGRPGGGRRAGGLHHDPSHPAERHRSAPY